MGEVNFSSPFHNFAAQTNQIKYIMNKYLKLIPMAFLASAALTVTSCSDDDDDAPFTTDPSVDNVFSEGLPASFDGATFTTNADGQVTVIKDKYDTYTFEYGTFSRAITFNVLMKRRENSRESSSGKDYYMQLGKEGFVTYILEVDSDDETDTEEWRFEYNRDGQMTRMQRTEGGDDFKMTYEGGRGCLTTKVRRPLFFLSKR